MKAFLRFTQGSVRVTAYGRCTKCSTPLVIDPDGWDRMCDACAAEDISAPLRRTASGWKCNRCPSTHYHGHVVNGVRV